MSRLQAGLKEVYDILKDYGMADRGCFLVFFLTDKNQMIDDETLFCGTINSSAVYPKEVVKQAIVCGTCFVILAHNHPSGDCQQSRCDKEITSRVLACCKLLDIRVIDHVIIGHGTLL